MYSKIQLRRGTATEWYNANPILADGESGYERDTGVFKVGDGVTAWRDLEEVGHDTYLRQDQYVPPSGGAGGAIVGMTRLQWTGANVTQANDAGSSRVYPGINAAVDTEYLADETKAPPITPDSVAGESGWTFDEAGWYIVRARIIGYFADPATAPARLEYRVEHDNVFFNMFGQSPVDYPVTGGTTTKDFVSDFTSRPMWMAAGEHMQVEWAWRTNVVATIGGHGIVAEIVRIAT